MGNNVFISAQKPLPSWDKQIQGLCIQVNDIMEKISQQEPTWLSKTMDTQMTWK